MRLTCVISPASKAKLLKQTATDMQQMATGARAASIKRVTGTPTSEGYWPIQRVAMPPQITTSTNPMNKKNLLAVPITYIQQTRNNNPDMLPPIEYKAREQYRSN